MEERKKAKDRTEGQWIVDFGKRIEMAVVNTYRTWRKERSQTFEYFQFKCTRETSSEAELSLASPQIA